MNIVLFNSDSLIVLGRADIFRYGKHTNLKYLSSEGEPSSIDLVTDEDQHNYILEEAMDSIRTGNPAYIPFYLEDGIKYFDGEGLIQK